MITLRDYQAQALDGLRTNIAAGIRNQVLCLGTGAGKTVIAGTMLGECHRKAKRAVFVVDRISLIDQTSKTLDDFGIPHGVIQANHWRAQPWQRIQVASIQTLARRGWPEDVDLIVIDECHSLYSEVTKRIDKRDAVTIGLSATPFTKGLGRHYQAVVSVTTTRTLQADGFLVPFRVFAASEPDMRGAKVKAGEWTDNEAAERSMAIVGDCVAEYLRLASGRKFIGFGATIAHCEEIQRQFMAAGVACELYTAHTPNETRAEIVGEFRKPDSQIRGLISVAALAKGFDVPDIGAVILARPLRNSFAEHIQMLGRGLRISPDTGKADCLILDHSGNCVRFWDRQQEFFATGEVVLDDGKKKPKAPSKPKEPRAVKCPSCYHVHDAAPACPACGHEYPKRKATVQHVPGSLKELVATGSRHTITAALWPQIVGLAHERDKSEKWALAQYHSIVGTWPTTKFFDTRPMPATAEVRNKVKSLQIAYARERAKGEWRPTA